MRGIGLLISLIMVLFFSCERTGRLKAYVVKGYYDNGKVKYVLSFDSNETRHGIDTFFYENGIVQSIHNFNKGIEEGAMVMWRLDGSLNTIVFYENDAKNGDFFIWRRNGRLSSKTFYRDNKVVSPPFKKSNSIDSSVLKCLINVGFNEIEALELLKMPYDSTEFGVPIR